MLSVRISLAGPAEMQHLSPCHKHIGTHQACCMHALSFELWSLSARVFYLQGSLSHAYLLQALQ